MLKELDVCVCVFVCVPNSLTSEWACHSIYRVVYPNVEKGCQPSLVPGWASALWCCARPGRLPVPTWSGSSATTADRSLSKFDQLPCSCPKLNKKPIRWVWPPPSPFPLLGCRLSYHARGVKSHHHQITTDVISVFTEASNIYLCVEVFISHRVRSTPSVTPKEPETQTLGAA